MCWIIVVFSYKYAPITQERNKGRAPSPVPSRWLMGVTPCHPNMNSFFHHPPADLTDLRAYLDYTGERATSPYDPISATQYSTITERFSKQSLVWLGFHIEELERRHQMDVSILCLFGGLSPVDDSTHFGGISYPRCL
eukprot:gene3495-6956_t